MSPDDFQTHVIDTLARLDTKMDTLVGEDGRVTKLEEDVEDLKVARWTITGMATGISIVASSIVNFIFKK